MSHVTLRVARELMPDLEDVFHLLGCSEISRSSASPDHVVLTLDAPMAPPGASSMTPWFHAEGDVVSVSSIEWFDATGARIPGG